MSGSDVAVFPAGRRVLDVPVKPPFSWVDSDPDWLVEGQTLEVCLEGPDAGRCAGLIQPAPGRSRYMPGPAGAAHPNWGRRFPDARDYPDGFRTFNRGPLVTDDGGVDRKVQVGRISLTGGHAQREIGASTIDEAVEWLHREGRFEQFAGDIGLIGRASAVESGPFAGAVMFRGMIAPGHTVDDALVVNTTTISGENWPDPQFGGRLVFSGAIRCFETAGPYDVPESLAAAVEGGPVYTSVSRVLAAETGVVDVERLSARLDDLVERVDGVAHEVGEMAAHVYGGQQVGLAEVVEGLAARVAELSGRVDADDSDAVGGLGSVFGG